MDKTNDVEHYRLVRAHYVSFTDRLKSLIDELCRINDVRTHLIEGRTKSVESFSEKIRRPGKSYADPINEVSDLSGVRIIVYYLDDVQKVSELLSNEFKIIESENSHLASGYSPDQFGYISLHSVIALNTDRARLPEWNAYRSFRSEIQIRTLLQHSWAAVSHALQYKHESDVPRQLRRKLYRLAGLFELADEEFTSVRNETKSIRNKVNQEFDAGNNQVIVNPIALNEFLNRWTKMKEIRSFMESIGYVFGNIDGEEEYEDKESNELEYLGCINYHCEKLGIRTIEEFEKTIDYNAESFLSRIIDGEWYVSEAFTLYLLFIRAEIDELNVEDLLEAGGWSDLIAKKVITNAKEDMVNTTC